MTHGELIERKEELNKQIASLKREKMLIEQQLQQIYTNDWNNTMKKVWEDRDPNDFIQVIY